MATIDFDSIDTWAADLSKVLRPVLPVDVVDRLRRAEPQYIEDARDIVLELGGREPMIELTASWIESNTIVAYHGTRLTDDELESVRRNGLVPLVATARRQRLIRALADYQASPDFPAALDVAIGKIGNGTSNGIREGQVHLTLSRSGLVNSFNHYLIHGSEFDQAVVVELLGQRGLDWLARDGASRVIHVNVPGKVALKTAHPFFDMAHLIERGDAPNMVGDFVASWSFKLVQPSFQTSRLKLDCGLFFREAVPAAWLSTFEAVELPEPGPIQAV